MVDFPSQNMQEMKSGRSLLHPLNIAPERKKDLAKLVTKAMFGGALASWLTATIAGILI